MVILSLIPDEMCDQGQYRLYRAAQTEKKLGKMSCDDMPECSVAESREVCLLA
jgi:hypothetical protein